MLTKEKILHHITHLEKQHDELDKRVMEETKHHGEDYIIRKLKKQKLDIKDEIEKMRKKINDCTE